MSVIPNTYVKYNSYIADANGDHRKVSTWTHADTVEMPDGTMLSEYEFGDAKYIEVTQAQYDALPSADKNDPSKLYFITDGGSATEIIGALVAGNTTLTLQDSSITTTATYDFYTDVFGVNPTDVQITTGQMVLTFEAQQNDISVKVRVS